jgi:hypothetical protein
VRGLVRGLEGLVAVGSKRTRRGGIMGSMSNRIDRAVAEASIAPSKVIIGGG